MDKRSTPTRPRALITALFAAAVTLSLVTPAQAGEFPDDWYYRGSRRPAELAAMEGKPAPPLALGNWIGQPQDTEGKVVVVDFWATWCGPCVRAIPKNNELVRKYAGHGLVFIGVHDAGRGWDRVQQVIRDKGINYPVALDQGGTSTRAWNLRFWPTYAVLDRHGIVRAIGLTPNAVESVVVRLLEEPGPANEPDWNEGTTRARRRFEELLAADGPPPIRATNWQNSEPLRLDDLRGKVVLLNFWTPSRPACLRRMRRDSGLFEKYANNGLVIVAICHSRGADRFLRYVERLGVSYPACVDDGSRTIEAYRVDGYPDYYLIDRAGKLRIADCKDDSVEDAVRFLLAEPEPKSTEADGDQLEQ